ncbi:unnamed protein product [Rotaria magnacalcarata]|uniref:Uncharacterized protein n=1 Tax=Rotaria magnacalcarata TaxID=392030 RepID=A0A816L411_9BILA|nr:unnamed protein product [Rotaria magnacalcarata]CAF1601848.1 unnamed protein product [Rotaria magnacalcarata]CAF1924003.1 unnamed protein product [Rotaria magnacalcarata]CAF3786325.1 unnamed protein product [Rotaria magnacalcarata]CAF4002954.1 unnamed protein product [Rotaria magnacalcarata]
MKTSLPSSLMIDRTNTSIANMPDEQRLFYTLMNGYEKAVRPIRKASDTILLKLGITLTQIMDVDERNQIMTTNIWLDQEWTDEFLRWNPDNYSGLKKLRIPCRYIWLPDVVLYNSADDYTQGYMQALAMIDSNGTVFWPPIVKFRSTCKIDITWFPFDDQLCFLKFGSWTYDSTQVILTNRSESVDTSNYVDNGEWKLMSSWTILSRITYPCCDESFYDLKFYFHVRRRTLYYIYNVMIPCIMLSILTCLTFYLPVESGEKVSLGLTVLLAFSVFMLLVAEAMPATSEFIPLIGIYFTLVMGLTSLSVLLAVVLLNIHLYGLALNPVSPRLRCILFHHLAPLLHVQLHRGTQYGKQNHPRYSTVITPRRATTIYNAVFLNERDLLANGQQHLSSHTFQSATMHGNNIDVDSTSTTDVQTAPQSLSECKRLLTELNRLILRPTETQEEDIIIRDWQNVALVIDRCLFVLYISSTMFLTIITLILAPLLKTVPKQPNYHQLNITMD